MNRNNAIAVANLSRATRGESQLRSGELHALTGLMLLAREQVDIMDDYLALMAVGHAPRTVELHATVLGTFSRWMDGYPCHATRLDVVTFLNQPHLSQNTRRNYRAVIARFLDWCQEEGHATAHAMKGVDKVKTPLGKPRPCPDYVIRYALSTAPWTTRRMITLGYLAGLRAAEIAAAHSDHLMGDHIRVTGKGNRTRMVPAHPEVADLYAAADGFLFPSRRGPHLTAKRVSEMVSGALDGQWTCHTLRHAFATNLYRATSDLMMVQDVLGHSSPSVTAIYVLPDQSAAVTAVAGLGLTA